MLSNAAGVGSEPDRISNSLGQIFQDAGFTALAKELGGDGGDALLQKVQDEIRKSSTSDALVEALAKVEAPILARSILGLFGVTPGMTEDDFLSKRNGWDDRKMSTSWGMLLTSHRGSSDNGGHEKSFFKNVKNLLIEGFNVKSYQAIEQVITDRAFAFLHDVETDWNKWKRKEALKPVSQNLKELIGDGWSESLAVPRSGLEESESSKIAPPSDLDAPPSDVEAAVRLVLDDLKNDSGDSIIDKVNELFPFPSESDQETPPALFFSELFSKLGTPNKVSKLGTPNNRNVDTRKASVVKMAIERGAIEDVKVFVEKETSFVADRVIGSHSEIFIQLARLLKDSPQSLKKLSDNLICRAHSSEDLNAVLIATPLTLWTDLSERAISNIRKIWRFDGVADGGFGNLQRRVGSAVRRLSASTEASDALNISGENAKRAKAAKDLVSRILSPHPGGNGESWSVLKTKLDRVCSEISRVDNGAIGDHQALNNDFLNQVRQIEAFQNLGENWRNFVIESCTGLNWSRGAAVEHLGARIKLINDCVEVQRCASELLGKFSNFSVSLSEPGTYLFYNGFHICVSEKDGPRFWLNVTNSSDVSQSRRREDNSALSSGLVAIPVVGSDNYNIYLKPHRFYCEQPDENPEELMLFIGGAVKHPRESLDTVLGISKN